MIHFELGCVAAAKLGCVAGWVEACVVGSVAGGGVGPSTVFSCRRASVYSCCSAGRGVGCVVEGRSTDSVKLSTWVGSMSTILRSRRSSAVLLKEFWLVVETVTMG